MRDLHALLEHLLVEDGPKGAQLTILNLTKCCVTKEVIVLNITLCHHVLLDQHPGLPE